jgi:hypothetical protein
MQSSLSFRCLEYVTHQQIYKWLLQKRASWLPGMVASDARFRLDRMVPISPGRVAGNQIDKYKVVFRRNQIDTTRSFPLTLVDLRCGMTWGCRRTKKPPEGESRGECGDIPRILDGDERYRDDHA